MFAEFKMAACQRALFTDLLAACARKPAWVLRERGGGISISLTPYDKHWIFNQY